MKKVCQCGHLEEEHNHTPEYIDYCPPCLFRKEYRYPFAHNFKQDNLKFIEGVYDERNKE